MSKLKAKMIVDFENPLSLRYAHKAKDTWLPLYDIIDIEYVQCITPTHPEYSSTPFCTQKVLNNQLDTSRHLRCNFRSFTEIAILTTYLKLWEQIADGEDFIMLEHDAFVRKGHEDTIRNLIKRRHEFKAQVFGSAMECWWISRQVAKNMVALAKRDFTHILRGPMWYLEMAAASEPVTDQHFEVDPKGDGPHQCYHFAKQFQRWVDTGVIGLLPYNKKMLWPVAESTKWSRPLTYEGTCALIYKNINPKTMKYSLKPSYEWLPEHHRNVTTYSRPVVQAIDVEQGITNMRYTHQQLKKPKDYFKGTGGLNVDLTEQPK